MRTECEIDQATIAVLGKHEYQRCSVEDSPMQDCWNLSGMHTVTTQWLIDAGAKFYREEPEPEVWGFGDYDYRFYKNQWERSLCDRGQWATAFETEVELLNALKRCGYFDKELQGWIDAAPEGDRDDHALGNHSIVERLREHREGK